MNNAFFWGFCLFGCGLFAGIVIVFLSKEIKAMPRQPTTEPLRLKNGDLKWLDKVVSEL